MARMSCHSPHHAHFDAMFSWVLIHAQFISGHEVAGVEQLTMAGTLRFGPSIGPSESSMASMTWNLSATINAVRKRALVGVFGHRFRQAL